MGLQAEEPTRVVGQDADIAEVKDRYALAYHEGYQSGYRAALRDAMSGLIALEEARLNGSGVVPQRLSDVEDSRGAPDDLDADQAERSDGSSDA